MTKSTFARRLRQGALGSENGMTDAEFDELYGEVWQAASERYWTPLAVAALAARWLTEEGDVRRVLDVGSGVGKLCIVGALTTRARFVGIEHRPALVRAAEAAALEAGIADRTTFVQGEVTLPLMAEHAAFYLFNPFAENTFSVEGRLDSTVELGVERYREDIALVEEGLRRAPIGARVVTYHGFGGNMPRGYVNEHYEPVGSDALQLWVKRHAR